MVAKRDHQGPILARVGIGDHRDLGAGDRTARIVEQRGVQAALGDARIRRRRKLRPREISLEELIGNKEPAAVVTVEQMMPAGEPEIRHAITPRRGIARPLYQHCDCDGVTMSATRTRREQRPKTRLARAAILAVSLAFVSCTGASAQPYPGKPIHIVVPFAPGGITDVLGRALGQRLSEAWGQQVVIENKPGGGTGQVVTECMSLSASDCYTLCVTADETFVTSPNVYSKLPYHPINDFVPISGLDISPQALVVHLSLPVRTLGELVDFAK